MDIANFTVEGAAHWSISSLEGEVAGAVAIVAETAADVAAREALLDDAMGPKRKAKSSEKLRRGRRPSTRQPGRTEPTTAP